MMKGDRMAKRSSFGNIVRRRLSDITNSLPQSKSPVNVEKPSMDPSSKEHIDHIVKENMALVKVIQDKNKLIEVSGIEIQRLRINLQKMQMQNWNLAQANSHMIAELNFSKEKMKSLQHEISCKEALFKAKTLEVMEDEVIAEEEIKCGTSRNRCHHFTRSRSLGHSTVSQQVAAKEAAENKRRCLRRQSANSKIQHSESSENLFEIEDLMLSNAGDFPMRVDGPPPPSSPIMSPKQERKDGKQHNAGLNSKPSERTSIGRPSRKAAEKVQSYKEIPLNTKMRRKD